MSESPGVPDQRQRDILKRLTERSAVHAGLYATALREFGCPPTSGFESARVAVMCHCARELMLGALDLLVDTPEPRQKPSSAARARDLPSVLARHASLDLRADQDLIPVPSEVAAAFADLIDTSTRETGRNKRNTAALVTGSADGSHPSIGQWSKTYAFFVTWAHVDQHHSGALPDDTTLAGQLRVVEDVIEVRMNLFFDNLSVVEDILALANEMDGIPE
ncbi:hypothetical protein NOU13_12995 [Rhodococcus erythropolis]|uniref:hypothetical protein n=1 Tax=Rhodococcus erythropolis TaxID=1833 RepID=UPI00038E5FF9|nr:hypothetical protein [Rhodococcus erythropolis]EQM32307.1 hypothetical protein N601_17075 [Rhodococcus erythropolis DN1]MCQ4125416.1 hypothetical protein [Rhodococcus erythropolis]MCS4253441.1 hypothetical protein [Rhodococcus erythropolis]MCW2427521.1 hypothetical protein [Rhodococcus erythropolis]